MGGSIANFAYGLPVYSEFPFNHCTQKSNPLLDLIRKEREDESEIYVDYYSGNSEVLGVFGVHLENIHQDEIAILSKLNLTPTEEQKAKVAAIIEGLPQDVKDYYTSRGFSLEPEVCVIVSDD